MPIIRWHVRQVFRVANHIVGRVTDSSAAEARQSGNGRRLILRNQCIQVFQRVSTFEFTTFVVDMIDDNFTARGCDRQKRIAADEAEPSDVLTAGHAFKQKRPGSGRDALIRRYGRNCWSG